MSTVRWNVTPGRTEGEEAKVGMEEGRVEYETAPTALRDN